ncbi:unnamed protein product [Hermetia illucens]|uniref:Uncharacterized protein n=1 Tax=Hermetia illucens TaxID=343691 RepID=A0A7R8V7I3_HERIL|nr:unnamed protein product [Hermetia illucens]
MSDLRKTKGEKSLVQGSDDGNYGEHSRGERPEAENCEGRETPAMDVSSGSEEDLDSESSDSAEGETVAKGKGGKGTWEEAKGSKKRRVTTPQQPSKGPAEERRAEGTSDEMFKAVKEIWEICLSKHYNVDKAATAAILEQEEKICVALLEKNGRGLTEERQTEGTSEELFKVAKEARDICLNERYNVDKAATAAILEQVENMQKIYVALLKKNGEMKRQRATGRATKVLRPPLGIKPAVVIKQVVPSNAEKRVPTTLAEVAAMKALPKTQAIEAMSKKGGKCSQLG